MLSRDEREYLRAMARGRLKEFEHPNPSVLRARIRKKAGILDKKIKDFVEDVALLDAFLSSERTQFPGTGFLMPKEFRNSPRAVLAWRALGEVPQERKILDARLEHLARSEPCTETIRKLIEVQGMMSAAVDRARALNRQAFGLPREVSNLTSAYFRALDELAQKAFKKFVASESRWIRSREKRLLIFECIRRNPGATREEAAGWLYAKGYGRRWVAPVTKQLAAKGILESQDGRYRLSAFGKRIWEKMKKDPRYLSRVKRLVRE